MTLPRIKPGDRFHKLVVIERAGSIRGHSAWKVRCDCGSVLVREANNLKRDKSSCGCSHPQHWKKGHEGRKIHGGAPRGAKAPLYKVWRGMISRCTYAGAKQYADYGGRGIYVCAEWLHDYAAFEAWASGNGHAAGLEIDRIDNDGPYSPENCRFVTRTRNQRNRRATRFIVVGGERMSLPDAAERFSIPRATLQLRIRKGEAPDDAVRDIPERRSRHGIKWGETQGPRIYA